MQVALSQLFDLRGQDRSQSLVELDSKKTKAHSCPLQHDIDDDNSLRL